MTFPSIRIEGAILSGDLLAKLDKGDFVGQRPSDFGFDSQAKLKEEIVRAWTAAQAFYTAFQHKLETVKEGAAATSETRNQWIIPLLGLLGYGELEFQSQSEFVGDKPFRISHHLRSHGAFHVHIVGARESLDKKPVTGPRVSPHAHLQEYLNLTEHLYGLVTNGKLLRLLRDSTRLIKLSYVEFDLDRMFSEELFADFAVFYRLLHVTRLPRSPEKSSESLLERYHQDALESGARIRDGLSFAVEQVVQELGSGFLARNENLRNAVADNSVTARELHHALLRLIYRLLLMMVAEERGLLFTDAATPRQRKLYLDHYSINRLRRLAERRALADSTKHDLWRGLRSTFRLFETDGPGAPLGLTGLGGQLFSAAALGPLQAAELDNGTLLSALAKLSLFRQPDTGQLSRVNYGALATEEFGSVYERLLELHPVINPAVSNLPPTFGFKQAAGNERKTSGSYYTPSSLVECLLDSALDPVLDDRLKNFAKLGYKSADDAVLALKVCDMACGSGHFLIAAAQRIARRLALLRSKGDEPSVSELRHTLREVISHCIYGVDINPMSVELCKVALWLEAMEAGKPLSFLDHHIRCGNSLLGATPALIAEGIPDDAFTAIEGDDKKACGALKKLNTREKLGFGELFALEDSVTSERLQQAAVAVENLPDDSVRAVEHKSAAFDQFLHNYDFAKATDLADLWCAAFVIRKRMADGEMFLAPTAQSAATEDQPAAKQTGLFGETFQESAGKSKMSTKVTAQPSGLAEAVGITSGHLRDFAKGAALPNGLMKEVQQIAGQYNFFHWHLAFPEVFRHGGFDVVLGNPPWERVNLEARQFFATIRPDIAEAMTSKRRDLLKVLATEHPELMREFQEAQRYSATEIAFYQNSGAYPHLNQARLNTYILFTELSARLTSNHGRSGIIVPSGVATDDTSKHLFSFLIENGRLVSLFDFENRDGLFAGVHRSYKFCLLTLGGENHTDAARLAFFLHQIEHLRDENRLFSLTAEELKLLSPITSLCPTFRCKRDRKIVLSLYGRVKPLVKQQEENFDWVQSDFLIMFRSDDSAHLYKTIAELGVAEPVPSSLPRLRVGETQYVPVWESKFLHQFDHRFATFATVDEADRKKGNTRELSPDEKEANWIALPRYWSPLSAVNEILGSRSWAHGWTLGYRDITNATNERTAIASCIPEGGAAQPLNLFLPQSGMHGIFWLASMNSLAVDYVARQRIGGVHLNITSCRQLPIIGPASVNPDKQQFVRDRVLELVFTSPALEAFAQDCGWSGPPFRWDEDRRFQLRCELDAAFFHLYGLNRDDTAYILDTFPIVKRKDEEQFGTYRTKDRILELYDALAEAQRTGKPFVSSLNPPPADARCCHPPKQLPIPVPIWMDRELVLPTSRRVVLTPDRYRAAVVPHLLYQSGGSVSFDRFRKAYWLLTEPKMLERYATNAVGEIARKWSRSFSDTLQKDMFIEHLKGAVGRQLHFIHKDGERWLELRDPKVADDEHVIFDARLALLVADIWPVAEPIAPLAPAEEIAIKQLEAVL